MFKDGQLNKEGYMLCKSHQVMSCTDDVALITSNIKQLQKIARKTVEVDYKMRLQINQEGQRI